MKSRRTIERAIQESPEVRVGEEGIAHKITLDNKDFFAKLWRGKHPVGHGDEHLYYSVESEKSPHSPFWAKLQYHEHKLMSEAFPDMVVHMVGAYDPRISKDGKTFAFQPGRPTTISEAVEAHEELMQQRDELINTAIYDDIAGQEIVDEKDIFKNRKGQDLHAAWMFDHNMSELFGRDINAVGHGGGMPDPQVEGSVERFVAKVNEKFPNTRMAELISGGIIPCHTAANFIPTGPSDERGVNGVIIEARIFDTDRLKQVLLQKRIEKNSGATSPEEIEKNIDRQLYRYRLLRKLDHLYNQTFMTRENWMSDEERETPIRQKAFDLLDRIRERYDKEGILFDDDFFHRMRHVLIQVGEHVEKWQQEGYQTGIELIDNWPNIKQKAA